MSPGEYATQRAHDHGIRAYDLRCDRRDRWLVHIRRTIARELRAEPWNLSYPEIGRALNRDHSTVIYLVRGGRKKKVTNDGPGPQTV